MTREGAADIEKTDFLAFFKRPYALIPQGKNKVLVAVPKFVKDFQVGWLWKETETFYIYPFDQYSAWLGDAPADLLEAINFKKGFEVQVVDDMVYFTPDQREAVKRKLGEHLRDVGEDSARIRRGHAFDVLAEPFAIEYEDTGQFMVTVVAACPADHVGHAADIRHP